MKKLLFSNHLLYFLKEWKRNRQEIILRQWQYVTELKHCTENCTGHTLLPCSYLIEKLLCGNSSPPFQLGIGKRKFAWSFIGCWNTIAEKQMMFVKIIKCRTIKCQKPLRRPLFVHFPSIYHETDAVAVGDSSFLCIPGFLRNPQSGGEAGIGAIRSHTVIWLQEQEICLADGNFQSKH